MPDLHKALADIDAIRTQVARGTEFRGYGPATVALTGLLALLASGIQALALDHPREQVGGYLAIWVGTAILSVALIGAETITRSRRLHRKAQNGRGVVSLTPILGPREVLGEGVIALWPLGGLRSSTFQRAAITRSRRLHRKVAGVGGSADLPCLPKH